MKKKLFILLTFILLGFGFQTKAHDFSVTNNNQTIYYKITSTTYPYTVAVTYKGSCPTEFTNEYTGDINILSSITHDGITYSITSIDFYAFYCCSGLNSVTIPNSITSIEESAFEDCSGLHSINIPSSISSIGINAFRSCSSLTYLNVDDFNNNFSSDNGILYSKIMDTLICCPSGKTGVVNIPNSVTNIAGHAFYKCCGLISISTGSQVISIGDNAFSGCNGLNSISISNSVILIGDYAFCNCSGLDSVYIPNSVISIGNSAFSRCDNLRTIYIGESVYSIGDDAFFGCFKLNSLNLPKYVNNIGEYVVANCFNLSSISSRAISPPRITQNTFYGVSRDIPLFVPDNSLLDYQYAPYWSEFNNIQHSIGLDDILNNDFSTKLYPNPAKDNATLEIEGYGDKTNVIVYDLSGRVIKSYFMKAGINQLQIDVSGFENGAYNIKVISNKNSTTRKLIVR